MKCTACGLPLSPSRNDGNCPRCGTPMSAGVGAPAQDRQWEQAAPSAAIQPPMARASQPGQMWAAGSNGMQEPGSFSPRQPAPKRPPRNSRVGFIVAGICVFTGGILLVLVYFLAMGQFRDTSTTGNTPTSTSATSSPAVTPS